MVDVLSRKARMSVRRLASFGRRWSRRPFRGLLSPFEADERPLLVHCGHHKIGTLWFHNVLGAVSDEFGLRYQKGIQTELRPTTDVFHQAHSDFDFSQVTHYRGSHIIRDLRDVIVSGYFYHLWTREAWARRPSERWQGKSYQGLLGSVDQAAGLLIEIDRFAARDLPNIASWNYADPHIVELRYEELLADEAAGFRRVFEKYGFRKAAAERAVELALSFSFSRISRRAIGTERKGTHLRSGRPGEWRSLFDDKHCAHVKDRLGETLIELGYEDDNDW